MESSADERQYLNREGSKYPDYANDEEGGMEGFCGLPACACCKEGQDGYLCCAPHARQRWICIGAVLSIVGVLGFLFSYMYILPAAGPLKGYVDTRFCVVKANTGVFTADGIVCPQTNKPYQCIEINVDYTTEKNNKLSNQRLSFITEDLTDRTKYEATDKKISSLCSAYSCEGAGASPLHSFITSQGHQRIEELAQLQPGQHIPCSYNDKGSIIFGRRFTKFEADVALYVPGFLAVAGFLSSLSLLAGNCVCCYFFPSTYSYSYYSDSDTSSGGPSKPSKRKV